MDMQGDDDKNNGFKLMHMNDIRISVKAKIEDLQELFAMDNDSLIHIARHFQWNEEKMQTTWFAEQEKLQFEIGVEYDKRLDKDPQIASSQP